MNLEEIYKILTIILSRISQEKFNWRIEGSANLLIQGVETNVNDFDITTDDYGIEIFHQALSDYETFYGWSEKINGNTLKLNINGHEVEINSYADRKYKFFEEIRWIDWRGLSIPILPLEYALKFYQLINREDKIKLIESHLDS